MIRPFVRDGGPAYLKQNLFHSRMIRPPGRGQARGQTGVSQRAPVGSRRSRSLDTPQRTIGTAHPGARASRPHAVPWVVARFPCDGAPVHPAGGNRRGPAQAEPGRLWRSIRVEEMGEALPVLCGRDARAPGWASSHDAGISRSRYRRCIRAPLVIEGGPSLFVFIRVHSWFAFFSSDPRGASDNRFRHARHTPHSPFSSQECNSR